MAAPKRRGSSKDTQRSIAHNKSTSGEVSWLADVIPVHLAGIVSILDVLSIADVIRPAVTYMRVNDIIDIIWPQARLHQALHDILVSFHGLASSDVAADGLRVAIHIATEAQVKDNFCLLASDAIRVLYQETQRGDGFPSGWRRGGYKLGLEEGEVASRQCVELDCGRRIRGW